MGIVQDVLVAFQPDPELFLFLGVVQFILVQLLSRFQGVEDGSVGTFHPDIGQMIKLGIALGHDPPQSPGGSVPDSLLHYPTAFGTVLEGIVLHLQVQQVADGPQLVADFLFKGKKGDGAGLLPQALDGLDIVGGFAGDVHHIDPQLLPQQVPGAPAADEQVFPLFHQLFGQGHCVLQFRHFHLYLEPLAGNQGSGPDCQVLRRCNETNLCVF